MIRLFSLIFSVLLISILWHISDLKANVDIVATSPEESDIELTNTLLAVLAIVFSIFTATVSYLYKTFSREAKKKIIATAEKIAKKVGEGKYEKFSIETQNKITNKIYREFNAKIIRQREFNRHHKEWNNSSNSDES